MRRPQRTVEAGTVRSGWVLRAAAAGLAIAGLVGCSHFGNSMLEITPAVFSDCQGPDISVRVSWDATPVVKDGIVGLYVYKLGQRPVLWKQAGPKGEADTGQWASDGWTVTMVDDHGRLLAVRTLQTTACPDAGE